MLQSALNDRVPSLLSTRVLLRHFSHLHRAFSLALFSPIFHRHPLSLSLFSDSSLTLLVAFPRTVATGAVSAPLDVPRRFALGATRPVRSEGSLTDNVRPKPSFARTRLSLFDLGTLEKSTLFLNACLSCTPSVGMRSCRVFVPRKRLHQRCVDCRGSVGPTRTLLHRHAPVFRAADSAETSHGISPSPCTRCTSFAIRYGYANLASSPSSTLSIPRAL